MDTSLVLREHHGGCAERSGPSFCCRVRPHLWRSYVNVGLSLSVSVSHLAGSAVPTRDLHVTLGTSSSEGSQRSHAWVAYSAQRGHSKLLWYFCINAHTFASRPGELQIQLASGCCWPWKFPSAPATDAQWQRRPRLQYPQPQWRHRIRHLHHLRMENTAFFQ